MKFEVGYEGHDVDVISSPSANLDINFFHIFHFLSAINNPLHF